jgi:hypothetical protein
MRMLLAVLIACVAVCSAEADEPAVRAANERYYQVLSARNLGEMQGLWAQTERDVNVAPPVRPKAHVGWSAIKQNYESFWGTLDEFAVSMENPTVVVEGSVAWVYGIEQSRRRTKSGEMSTGANFGSSIFIKRDGRWLMIFHQAAPMSR